MDIDTVSAIHSVWKKRVDQYRKSDFNDPKSLFKINQGENSLFWKDSWYTEDQINILRTDDNFNVRYKHLLDNRSDIPSEFISEYYPSSGCNISHVYQLKLILDTFGSDLSNYHNILEFGSGYGNLCNLFYKIGYKNKYHICELDPVVNIAKKYLENNNVPMDNINFKPKDNIDYDLFIGFYSISETLPDVRNRIIENTSYKNIMSKKKLIM